MSANPVTSGSNAKTYTIRKLADGNCWMSESLFLPLAIDVGVESSYDDGTIFSYIPTSIASIGVNTRIGAGDLANYYYYNWYAATAEKGVDSTTGDTDGSICPKGWKMPQNSSSTPSWSTLITIYGAYRQNIESVPLSLVRSDFYANGHFYENSGYGEYWSATTSTSSAYAYYLDYTASVINPQRANGSKSSHGFNIRCVASPLTH